jgi:endonuclease/exonuclease/phosphatase family metal-dependent hydrolase
MIKILTYNLHGVDEPVSVRKRIKILADYCKENSVNIICGQEFAAGITALLFHFIWDAARVLAKDLEFDYLSSLTWEKYWLQYRTGVITTWKQDLGKGVELSYNKGATLVCANDIWIASVHASSAEAPMQLEQVIYQIPPNSQTIIAGDFNDASTKLNEVATRFNYIEGKTFGIDRCFVKNFEIIDNEQIDLGISDHKGILTILK